MEDIFVTRQAIHNSHNEVIGYELLYHDGSITRATPCTDAEQSAQLITNTFMGIGLENLVGSNKAFINLSHDFFSNEHPIPMASHQVVLEVPGNCIEDHQVYQELRQLAKQGYTLSLYDYEYKESTAERLDCIDIVKLDISNYDTNALKEQTRYYRNHGKRLHLKGLETSSQQLLCSQLGIDYFQGDLFSPIDSITGRTTVSDCQLLRDIADSSQQDPLNIAALAQMVSQDATLCYKLFRYINCASFTERSEIQSLEQALTLIGSCTLKQWARLLLTAEEHISYKIKNSNNSLIRANMCYHLAIKEKDISPSEAFLVGLFSTLDEAMDTPLDDLLDSITLSPNASFALIYGEGPLGHLLQQVKYFEKQEWAKLDTSQIAREDYTSSYQIALHTAQTACYQQ